MEKSINLKFCNLIYSEKDKCFDREKKLVIKAFNYNKDFFKIEVAKFDIKFVYSRLEFNKLWGEKTKDFVSGFTRDSKITLFAYSVFDKETRWKKKDFYECLVHEISHLFYEELRDDSYDPLWLSEGLATFIQHNQKRSNYKKKLIIKKEILDEGFERMIMDSYQVYNLFVEYLILNFSKDKILDLILELKKRTKVDDAFQKIYKKSFVKLIEDANKYKKTTRSRRF